MLTPSGVGPSFTAQIGYNAWSSTTAYSIGDFVSDAGNAYQSLTEGNLNNDPTTHPLNWQQVNAGAAVGVNGFQAGDVGRLIRLLSEPAAWAPGTGYSAGQAVQYNNAYYVAQTSTVGQEPDTNISAWLPTTSLAVACWMWGRISAVNSSSNATVVLLGDQQALLYNAVINTWRIGTYSDAVGWPTCGAYYAGRLWLGGVVPNRFDASMTNDIFVFSPTAEDGTVGDANAIDEVFNSDEKATIYWFEPGASGLHVGTKKGEWLIAASTLKDPITPTSIQADRSSKVGCAPILPATTPMTLVVVQRFTRLIYELFPDLYSGKITAPNLNSMSKHLTSPGLAEITYQSELAPIVWGRNADNSLVGWTYRRSAPRAESDPDFVGGHRHTLGSGRSVSGISMSATPSQTSDGLVLVTKDANNVYHIEQMTRILDPSDLLTSAWFVDDAVTPSGMTVNYTNGVAVSVTFYGYWHLNGATISAVCGGLDLGDYPVANGSFTVPFTSIFTLAYLQSLNASTYGDLATVINNSVTSVPGYVSQPQTINEIVMPNDAVTGISGTAIIPNFGDNTAIILGTNGIRKVNLANFTQISDASYAAIGATFGGGWVPDTGFAFTRSNNGKLVWRAQGSNQSPWILIDPASWAITASFGTNNNFWSDGATGLGAPSSIVPVTLNGINYVAATVQISAFGRSISWVNTDTFGYVAGSSFHVTNGFECVLAVTAGGSVYGIEAPLGGTNPTPVSVMLYHSTPASTVQVGTIAASSIDPAWTNINSINGFVVDQKDGNILLAVSTGTAGVANANYLCKMRAADGSFIWKTPVVALPGSGLGVCRSQNGVIGWIGEAQSGTTRYIYQFNTVNGTFTKYTETNAVPFGSTFTDDVTGLLYGYVQYSQTGGSPVPGPGTPSSFQSWAVFTIGNIFTGSTTATSSYTIPAVAGYTFTSLVRITRPAAPQEAGAANGPALGKTRRNHMFSVLLAAAIYGTVSFGTVFGKLRPAFFKQANNAAYDTKTLFTGVHWSTVEDNYDFEGGLAWEVTRPLPASIVSIGGFLNTQDR